jgi:hypothetical protein
MPTAADAYRAARSEARERLNAIERALFEHERRHDRDPENWGFAGDLGRANELLVEALQALIPPGARFGWEGDEIVILRQPDVPDPKR